MTTTATEVREEICYRLRLLGRSKDDTLRKGPRTAERIRWAACELLETLSLDALTVQDICREAGIAQGTLYQYFTSRNDLLASVLNDFVAFLRQRMHGAVAGNESTGDSVDRSTRIYCELFCANRGLMKCLLNHFDTFPEARSILSAFNKEWIDLVVRRMGRLRDVGKPSTQEIRRRAYALGGMVDQYLAAIFLYEDRDAISTAGSMDDIVKTLTFIWRQAFADVLGITGMDDTAR